MKNNFKKIIILFTPIFLLFVNKNIEASSLSFQPSNTEVNIGEQFYVDIIINPEGKRINGIEGTINFPQNNLSFVRAEEAKSIVGLWVEKPTDTDGNIHFAGVIPNGFDGVIDPFNPSVKLPGLVVRLVFEGKGHTESALILLDKFYSTLNDGLGTTENIKQSSLKISVKDFSSPVTYKTEDSNPELTAYVTRDPNLFDNEYVLIFDAHDSQSGIKEVLVKEGKGDWEKIESPYLLKDQTRHSIIKLQAINYSGFNVTITIAPLSYGLFQLKNIIFIIILLILLFVFVKKKYEKRKITHN